MGIIILRKSGNPEEKGDKTMRNKLNGETDFTWNEALKVRNIVNPAMEMETMFQTDEKEVV